MAVNAAHRDVGGASFDFRSKESLRPCGFSILFPDFTELDQLSCSGGRGISVVPYLIEILGVPTYYGVSPLIMDFGGRMKLFNDPASGNLSAWLYVEYKDGTENRWTIDLVFLSITDDGQYAAIPDGVTVTVNPVDQNVFDGQGNLWQQGYIVEGETRYDVIIKRPLASSSMVSTVEYSEASYTGGLDWEVETSPYAVINHHSPLFTGP
jgi:hypothetical protein